MIIASARRGLSVSRAVGGVCLGAASQRDYGAAALWEQVIQQKAGESIACDPGARARGRMSERVVWRTVVWFGGAAGRGAKFERERGSAQEAGAPGVKTAGTTSVGGEELFWVSRSRWENGHSSVTSESSTGRLEVWLS